MSQLTLRMSRRTSETNIGTETGSPGGSIRLVCRGTALPLANLRGRIRVSAPMRESLSGVPDVQRAAKHRPDVAAEREAHPQRLPVHFVSVFHGQTILLTVK